MRRQAKPHLVVVVSSVLSVLLLVGNTRLAKGAEQDRLMRGTDVMFILDYSGSMASGPNATRYIAAREILLRCMARLLPPPGRVESLNRVGLIVYGHRVGWLQRDGKWEPVIRDPKNPTVFIPRPAGMTLEPWDDVEMVLPPGHFDQTSFAQVQQKLASLLPLGETPLYLSISQAFDGLAALPAAPGRNRHIVVITDGPDDRTGGVPITPADVQRKSQSLAGIRLDVVGFKLDASEQKAKLEQLKTLAQSTGGAYIAAEDSVAINKALDKMFPAPR